MDFQQNKTTLNFIDEVNRIMTLGLADSHRDIVDKIEWDKSNFSSVMNGRRNVPLEVFNKLKLVFKTDNLQVVSEGIPVYDAIATGSVNENVSQLSGQPLFRMNLPGYEDCKMGIYHYGHSMYPTIESGNLLLLKPVNDKSIIMYGEIYVVRTEDYHMVKRLQKNSQAGHVLCTSDNFEKRSEDFRRFEPFDMPIDKIIDLYLVKGIIRKTQS